MKNERREIWQQAGKDDGRPVPPYKKDDKDYVETGREYDNDKSEDTGIPGFGVQGDEGDESIEDDTKENR